MRASRRLYQATTRCPVMATITAASTTSTSSAGERARLQALAGQHRGEQE